MPTRTMPPVAEQLPVLMSGVEYGDAGLYRQMESELKALLESSKALGRSVSRGAVPSSDPTRSGLASLIQSALFGSVNPIR